MNAREEEYLRQARASFDQTSRQIAQWNTLRLVTGFVAVIGLPAIAGFCVYVMMNHTSFPPAVVTACSVTFVGDFAALLATIWKGIIGTGEPKAVAPNISRPRVEQTRQLPNHPGSPLDLPSAKEASPYSDGTT